MGSGQRAELLGGHAHQGRDVLEEVLHRAGARLQELAHAVVHVLVDIGQLVLLDAYGLRRKGGLLEFCRPGIGDLRQPCDLSGGFSGRLDPGDASGGSNSGSSGDGLASYRRVLLDVRSPLLRAARCLIQWAGKAADLGYQIEGEGSKAIRHSSLHWSE
ncbi:hypothetical protein D9M69_431130 [compost metagenome]